MRSDIEIAQGIKLLPIMRVAETAGLLAEEVEPHGQYKAKIKLSVLDRLKNRPDGKLILVTAMTPTVAGNGKTTLTIGLGQALRKLGKKSLIALREPSLGPVMGRKGGATGGGYSQVLPMEDINLHFNGDMHMVTAAHNLLAAMLDNHIHFDNQLGLDPQRIFWRRVIDLNDRSLRKIIIGLGEGKNGVQREDGFDITASSEVMAVLCLAQNWVDLKERLGRIIVGEKYDRACVTAADLKADGAMAVLLKEAFLPNLVQSLEGVPAFIHGGPFANIAHGCNSLMATKMALKLADYVVTEAGFGSDLGAEKFFDIKCRLGNLRPNAVVLTVTTNALCRQSGLPEDKFVMDAKALAGGLANLSQHLEIIRNFNLPVVVAINRRSQDSDDELQWLMKKIKELGAEAKVCEVWAKGSEGGRDLAEEVVKLCQKPAVLKFVYDLKWPIKEKIEAIAKKVYGAKGVQFSPEAQRDIEEISRAGYCDLPVCVAKTQFSLSDEAERLGRPKDFDLKVSLVKVSAGAGFLVVYTGHVLTMPGLPVHPAAENLDLDANGQIKGLF